MDSLELQNYEENLKIISLIKHIVYSCWEDIDVYNYTHDIEVDTVKTKMKMMTIIMRIILLEKKINGGKKIYSYINEIISRIFFSTTLLGIFIAYIILPIPTIIYRQDYYNVDKVSDDSKCYGYQSQEITCLK